MSMDDYSPPRSDVDCNRITAGNSTLMRHARDELAAQVAERMGGKVLMIGVWMRSKK